MSPHIWCLRKAEKAAPIDPEVPLWKTVLWQTSYCHPWYTPNISHLTKLRFWSWIGFSHLRKPRWDMGILRGESSCAPAYRLRLRVESCWKLWIWRCLGAQSVEGTSEPCRASPLKLVQRPLAFLPLESRQNVKLSKIISWKFYVCRACLV